MALNYVNLTFTEQDAGNSPSAGSVVIAPTSTVVAAGQTVVSAAPVSRQLGSGSVSVSLVACDNTGTTPAAGFWAYQITLPGGQPQLYLVNFANGANQQFSNLTPVVAEITYGQAASSSGFTNPMTTLGDLIAEDATPAAVRLAGNTTATRKFLRQTGTGTVSALPAWDTLQAADLPAATQPWQFTAEAYGAKGDGRIIGDATISAGNLSQLTSASAPFTSADIGKHMIVNNAGPGGLPLITTITFVNATTVTLGTAASGAVSGTAAVYGTDDTAAVNSAMSAAGTYALANDYYAQVVLSPKIYCLASGPTQTGNGTTTPTFNSQVPLPYPNANGTTRKLIIEIAGPGEAAQCQYWESTVPNLGGPCLMSMITAPSTPDVTFGRQSVLGGPSGAAGFTGGYANVKAVVRNVMVAVPYITNSIAYDFSCISAIHVDGCSAQAFAPVAGSGIILPNLPALNSFQSTISIGLRAPVIGNNDDVTVPSFAVEGFETGLRVQDHFAAGRIATIYCDLAILIDLTSGASGNSHAVSIANWSCEVVNGALKSNGSTYCALNIGLLDGENASISYDISDTGNSLYGVVHWTDLLRSSPVVSGAANLKIINDRLGPGAWSGAPAVPSSTTPQQNTSWRAAAVTISGGTVTAIAVDGVTLGVTSGTVIVPSGKNITLTYSVAPTWKWTLL